MLISLPTVAFKKQSQNKNPSAVILICSHIKFVKNIDRYKTSKRFCCTATQSTHMSIWGPININLLLSETVKMEDMRLKTGRHEDWMGSYWSAHVGHRSAIHLTKHCSDTKAIIMAWIMAISWLTAPWGALHSSCSTKASSQLSCATWLHQVNDGKLE